jgi:hypothetical protein
VTPSDSLAILAAHADLIPFFAQQVCINSCVLLRYVVDGSCLVLDGCNVT